MLQHAQQCITKLEAVLAVLTAHNVTMSRSMDVLEVSVKEQKIQDVVERCSQIFSAQGSIKAALHALFPNLQPDVFNTLSAEARFALTKEALPHFTTLNVRFCEEVLRQTGEATDLMQQLKFKEAEAILDGCMRKLEGHEPVVADKAPEMLAGHAGAAKSGFATLAEWGQRHWGKLTVGGALLAAVVAGVGMMGEQRSREAERRSNTAAAGNYRA